MTRRLIVALDGHDGAGKSTLATALAARLGGIAARPYAGAVGKHLRNTGERHDVAGLVRTGSAAINAAISCVRGSGPIVLDRAWMTAASFVPDSEAFFEQWDAWIPTTLCWADLPTTLSRLATRPGEAADPEAEDWHRHYLSVYLTLAKRTNCPVLRTDESDIQTCVARLSEWAAATARQ